MTWTLSSIAKDPTYAESWQEQFNLFIAYMWGRLIKWASDPSERRDVDFVDGVMEKAWDALCPQLREEIEKQEERYGILELTSAEGNAALASATMTATLQTMRSLRGDQLLH